MDEVVQAPAALLLHPRLGAVTKVVWMASRLGAPGSQSIPSLLAGLVHLHRTTVFRALPELSTAGWDLAVPVGDSPTVPIPRSLLTNAALSPHAKVLYGLLLLTPGFCHPFGRFSFAELSALAHFGVHTLIKAVADLVRAEWIIIERRNRKAKVHFHLTFPGLDHSLNQIADAEWRLEIAEFFGEALMREYLALLVDSQDFIDNGSPAILQNPETGLLLQLDRFYPPRVGIEFNGPQHHKATRKYGEAKVAKQRHRDYIKIGLCATHGIDLVIIHPEDLTLRGVRQKVEGHLPLRDISADDLLLDYLEEKSLEYREWVATL